MDGLPFVTGAIWHRPRDVTVHVRVMERHPKDRAARKWKSRIKQADGRSATELLHLLNPNRPRHPKDAAARKLRLQSRTLQSRTAHRLIHAAFRQKKRKGPIFTSAAYYGNLLSKRKGCFTPSEKVSPVLARLAARVQDMIEEGQVDLRALANVLYSLGRLADDLEVPEGLLMALVKSFSRKTENVVTTSVNTEPIKEVRNG